MKENIKYGVVVAFEWQADSFPGKYEVSPVPCHIRVLYSGISTLTRCWSAASYTSKNFFSKEKDSHAPLLQICRASHAHGYTLVFKAFKAVVDNSSEAAAGASTTQWGLKRPEPALDGATCYALDLLLSLFGLYWLQNDMGDFVEDGRRGVLCCVERTPAYGAARVVCCHALRGC